MEFAGITHVAGLAALAVVAAQQILKLNAVPLSFANDHPVPTNIVLSLLAAFVAVWQDAVAQPTTIAGWIAFVATISVVAAIVYNQLIGKSHEIKALEGSLLWVVLIIILILVLAGRL